MFLQVSTSVSEEFKEFKVFNPFIVYNVEKRYGLWCFGMKNNVDQYDSWHICNKSQYKSSVCQSRFARLQKIIRLKNRQWKWELYNPPYIIPLKYVHDLRDEFRDEKILLFKKCYLEKYQKKLTII